MVHHDLQHSPAHLKLLVSKYTEPLTSYPMPLLTMRSMYWITCEAIMHQGYC
jgi:hypothetical protein